MVPESTARAEPDEPAPDPKLMAELRRDVDKLSAEVGERHSRLGWELAEVADYLASELEASGYEVERQGIELDGGKAVVQNLSATVRGGARGDESIVVAAYYDSAPHSRGAQDNATGTAAVLALARHARRARPDRTVRFVLLVNEQEPFSGTEEMGSLRFARQLASRGERVAATIALRSLGSPRAAPAGARRTPAIALSVMGPAWVDPLVARVVQLLAPSIRVSVARTDPGRGSIASGRGAWGFWQAGIAAVVLTSADRSPALSPDSPETAIDYAAMARRVEALASMVSGLAEVTASGEPSAPADPQPARPEHHQP